MSRSGIFPLLSLLAGSCTQPISLEEVSGDLGTLVIEGIITDQSQKQQISITRTVQLKADVTGVAVTNAQVQIAVNQERLLEFEEEEPGIYRSKEVYAGQVGSEYQLFFTLANGAIYQSEKVEMLATPEIDSVYATFTSNPIINRDGGNFDFFLDARSNSTQSHHFRWTWTSASALLMETPSRYEWLGGNETRVRERGGDNDQDQVELCWIVKQSPQILVSSEPVEGLGIRSQQIHGFHSDSKAMRVSFGIEVKQYGLSDASYRYWSLLAETNQGSGFLFDKQVGPVPGNVVNTRDKEELVLGIFEAAEEKVYYRQFHPLEFWRQGYLRTTGFHIDCSDIQALQTTTDEIGEFMERNASGWEIGFFVTGGMVYYFPKRCANCTLYGTNQKPDFWL